MIIVDFKLFNTSPWLILVQNLFYLTVSGLNSLKLRELQNRGTR